jgi:uncharacterized protein (DUF2345 family)
VTAADAVQLANGETVSLMSGQDTQFVTGGAMRMHTGQAIGVLAGAVKAGEGGVGLQMMAAQDAVDVQAQAGTLDVQARDDVHVVSANAHVDWAAAKRISLSTADGANITIEGGNITVQCPGKIAVHAGKKSFAGPQKLEYSLPALPAANMPNRFSNRIDAHDIFMRQTFSDVVYKVRMPDDRILSGTLDEHGRTTRVYSVASEKLDVLIGRTMDEWDMVADYDPNESDDIRSQ